MHTTAIIIVHWRKKGETTAYVRTEGGGGGRRVLFSGKKGGVKGRVWARETRFARCAQYGMFF